MNPPKAAHFAVASRRLLVIAALAGLAQTSSPIAAAAAIRRGADVERLRSHLRQVGRFGPRPSGSAANAAAADHLARALRSAGFQVRISSGEGLSVETGTAGMVRNVVGWLPANSGPDPGLGTRAGSPPDSARQAREALLLVSHYDSVVDGPGGTDNAASVAAILVAVEDLVETTRRRPVIVLFTDAEERGLLGAEWFVRADSLASRVGAIVNFDHAGRTGGLYNFEIGPGSGALQRALWSIPNFPNAPRSFSFASDIYRVLPFDTDFTALSKLGVPGLNFALVGDGYAYHTSQDLADAVPDASLLAMHRTLAGLLERLVVGGEPIAAEEKARWLVFFPVGNVVFRLTRSMILGLMVVGLLLGLSALALAVRGDRRGMLRGLAAVFLAVPLTLASCAIALQAMRAVKGVNQVAYASPWPLFLLFGSIAATSGFTLGRWMGSASRPRPVRLAAALLPWILVAPLAALAIPASSAFFVIPLIALALAALAASRGDGLGLTMAACGLAIVPAALVWAEPLATLLPFLVTTFPKVGPEPLLFWPALFAVLGMFFAPLGWSLAGEGRAGRWVFVLVGALGVIGAAAVLARPAYDTTHAQRTWAFHVTAPDTAYEVLTSPDRLGETGERQGGGREAQELFWIGPDWSRRAWPARSRSPLPVVQALREGERLRVAVKPPPGTDFVTLVVEGAEIEASDPPAAGFGSRRLLRRVGAGNDSVRFEVDGRFTEEARVRVMCTAPGLTRDAVLAEVANRSGRARTLLARTIAVAEVELP